MKSKTIPSPLELKIALQHKMKIDRLNQSDIERITSVGQKTISNILNENMKQGPTLETAFKLVERLDLDFVDGVKEASTKEFRIVPTLDTRSAAIDVLMTGEWPMIDTHHAFRHSLLESLGVQQHQLAVMSTADESMTPTLAPGDTVLLDLTDNIIENGSVYAYVYRGKAQIKRLYKMEDEIVVHSDNDSDPRYRYDEKIKDMNYMKVIGRALNRSGSWGL